MTDETKEVQDTKFNDDWNVAREHWRRIHRIYDMSYLSYRSILTNTAIYGKNFVDAFGLQVFVPRTFQTVEALKAPINSVKIQFVNKSRSKKNEDSARYFQTLDNAEWERAEDQTALSECHHNALIFGNGYLLNEFVNDTAVRHFVTDADETLDVPNDGIEKSSKSAGHEKQELEWEERTITKYKGMKLRNLNPYYVFWSPSSLTDNDAEYCYLYTPTNIFRLREWVVSKGWMTQAEAEEKIKETPVEYFDGIRDTIDSFYDYQYDRYSRGDHVNYPTNRPASKEQPPNMTAILERFEEDYYEVRIAGTDIVLYKDFNVYPHKEIPISTMWDVKIPGERRGVGEPELIRYQQLEENKLHNMLMHTILMTMVQRYAIRKDLFEDETDLYFNNPFKPLILKPIPGVNVQQGFQPLPQPEVKRSPFELIEMVKNISQQTTGASDFVVSGNSATTETATESNNLLAATNARLREKARQMDEATLRRIIKQRHPCYLDFYDEEMDIMLTGEEEYGVFLPYDRSEANENLQLIDQKSKELNVVGAVTLEEVYLKAGYKIVCFASDLSGDMIVSVIITDVALDATRKFNQIMNAVRTMAEVNKSVNPQMSKQFDVMKLATEAFKSLDFIKDIDGYLIEPQGAIMNPQSGGALSMNNFNLDEEQRSGAIASEESGVEVGGPQPAAEGNI